MYKPEAWFVKELQTISPDLRMVWGRERYGWNCWVVERQIPSVKWAQIYRTALAHGKPRFVHQRMSDGTYRHYDTMPEWLGVHFVRTPEGEFRQPDRRDLMSIRRWMFEFDRPEDQDVHDKNRFESQQAKLRDDTYDRFAYEVKNFRNWVDPHTGKDYDPFGGQPTQIFEGTDLGATQGVAVGA